MYYLFKQNLIKVFRGFCGSQNALKKTNILIEDAKEQEENEKTGVTHFEFTNHLNAEAKIDRKID